jgi:hypothetical protein
MSLEILRANHCAAVLDARSGADIASAFLASAVVVLCTAVIAIRMCHACASLNHATNRKET